MKLENLRGTIPLSVINQISSVYKFHIDTPLRLAHFLAQCAHESADFTRVRENLNYSANGLLKTFPKYFNAETAKTYAYNPELIANRVYYKRMGNTEPNDGFLMRGRGYIQLTGKDNYKSFGDSIGVDLVSNPDLVATQYPLLSAAWFWDTNKLNKLADANDITAITKKINGGLNGFEARKAKFDKIYKLLSKIYS